MAGGTGAGEGGGAGGSIAAGRGDTGGRGQGGAGGLGGGLRGPSGGRGGQGGTSGGVTPYFLGADVTNAQWASSAAQDDLFNQLAEHGFNAIRARTFVDPKAADGYDPASGVSDLAHTVAWAKRIKAHGFAFLLDFHYSDNWADPGKQCVPIAWQSLATIGALAQAVHDYTKMALTELVAAGATPDMVQVGNEITPGMLMHRCDSAGAPTGPNAVSGSNANWANLGMLLKAGIQAVKEIDPKILIMLHIDRCNDLTTSKWWVDRAFEQGVTFDVLGQSCYQSYQGDPTSVSKTVAEWTSTFQQLAAAYPNLKFVAAEYGPLAREVNDVLFGMAGGRGLGTFSWEPDSEGDWNRGHALFSLSQDRFVAQPDLGLYDLMKRDYASRL
jgi:arabinogalactan endo-1,4-beta-galactosidase